MISLSLTAAFVAGLISFLSPCVLPLLPAFVAYLAGEQHPSRLRAFLHAVAYVAGFSAVFALLGVLLNSFLPGISASVQTWLSRVAGVLIIIFGLNLAELLELPWLSKEHRVVAPSSKITYARSFVLGASFAVGWTPCVGAILGSVLALAVVSPGQSFWLLLSYAFGLSIPFLIIAVVSDKLMRFLKIGKFLYYLRIVMGIFLVFLGILVFTQALNYVVGLLPLSGVIDKVVLS